MVAPQSDGRESDGLDDPVNGFLVDARFLKREVQEEALRKGLIPYIPERPIPSNDDEE